MSCLILYFRMSSCPSVLLNNSKEYKQLPTQPILCCLFLDQPQSQERGQDDPAGCI